jgi:hypothetical protein
MAKDATRASGYFFNLSLVLAILFFISSSAHAADPDFCTTRSAAITVVDAVYEVTGNCEINGDLHITDGGRLFVNYTKSPGNILNVLGNIKLQGDGILYLKGGVLQIPQDYSMHRTIDLEGDSILVIIEGELKTNSQPDTANKYMLLKAYNNSRMLVFNSNLDRKTSWLLANFFDQSQLVASQSESVPTEVYIKDSSNIRIYGDKSNLEVWFDLTAGAAGILDLPDQTDGVNSIPYSWTVGRDTANLTGVDWQLAIYNAKVGLGIESRKNSSVTINGRGIPDTGEITVGYFVEGSTETLDGLGVGLQNLILGGPSPDSPQLTLNNVNLGPIAWQIYVLNGGTTQILNSVVNEVAAVNATVDIQNSELQLAVVASYGPTGSMTITDTNIHSQLLEADLGGKITIQRSTVYGSQMRAGGGNTSIRVENGEFLFNAPPLASSCGLDNALSLDGTILCNPFLPEYSPVTRQQSADDLITCDLTTNCSWIP